MAAGTKIVLSFGKADGKTVNYSYNYGDDDASTAAVTTAMNSLITNGDIFKYPPVSIKSAKAVITSEVEFAVS